ncbi:hypothetical protein BDF20DRAFT_865834 [Mycotypha africana]|uniref:uncharacterized protein n=1 Tax=Mycotypha africana TaxID=64632 RepID=UPI002301AA8B|nr:uncharacterized protein BDF20DRAFT_865834 [Mycotypha africana]KAI8982254.1 hypothetical protein BDF20DRAFT_865834 [Mycotypha africana]
MILSDVFENLVEVDESKESVSRDVDHDDDHDRAVLGSLHEQILRNDKRSQSVNDVTQQQQPPSLQASLSSSALSDAVFMTHHDTSSRQKSQHKSCISRRSAFSFIDQAQQEPADQRPLPAERHRRFTSMVVPKFSSSFIMEDMFREDEGEGTSDNSSQSSSQASKRKGNNNRPFLSAFEFMKNESQRKVGNHVLKNKLMPSITTASNSSGSGSSSSRSSHWSHSTGALSDIKLDQMVHQPTFSFIEQGRSTSSSLLQPCFQEIDSSSDDSDDVDGSKERQEESVGKKVVQSMLQSDCEMQLLHHTARWEKFQEKKTKRLDSLRKLCKRGEQTQKTIDEMSEKLHRLEAQQSEAVAKEDFEAAEIYRQQQESLQNSMCELNVYLTRTIHVKLKKERERLQQLLMQEEEGFLQPLLRCCETAQQTRTRHLQQFIQDTDRLKASAMEAVKAKQTALESEKSELALDIQLLHENERDLEGLIAEATHEAEQEKQGLVQEVEQLQEEMDALKRQWQQLEAEKAKKEREIQTWTLAIEKTKNEFKEEAEGLNNERSDVEERRLALEKKEEELKEEEEKVNRTWTRWIKEKQVMENDVQWTVDKIRELEETNRRDKRMAADMELLSLKLEQLESREQMREEANAKDIKRLEEKMMELRQCIHKRTSELQQKEESCLQLMEAIGQLGQQIQRLTKYKERAVRREQFTNASKYMLQIETCQGFLKEKEAALAKEEEGRLENDSHGEDESDKEKELECWKDELSKLEKEYESIKEEQASMAKKGRQQLTKELFMTPNHGVDWVPSEFATQYPSKAPIWGDYLVSFDVHNRTKF